MLSRELRQRLDAHRRGGFFYAPQRDLRKVKNLQTSEFDTWVGERPDGTLELVRSARGAAALELILNEADAVGSVSDSGLARLLWSVRPDDEALTLGFAWPGGLDLAYPLDLRWLLRAFIRLSKVVGTLHRAGRLHADIKPEAVCWTEDPQDLLLWDLRISQAPGPRAFEAFSARFAAPEQVAGDSLTPATDVYSLGVMLYSLFIRDRFPSILLPKRGSAPSGPRQAALSAVTAIGAFDNESPLDDSGTHVEGLLNVTPQRNVPRAPRPSGQRTDHQAILGAKILFALELDRVLERTTDIGVAKELLGVIERATAQKAAERHKDADELAADFAKLLTLAEELAS